MEIWNIILFQIICCMLAYIAFKSLFNEARKTQAEIHEADRPPSFPEKNAPYVVAGLLLLGILIRVIRFGQFPVGLNQDEASIGYDAFATMYYGMDRNGYYLPMYPMSWGDGQNALYMYLSMPFISFFVSVNYNTVFRFPSFR